MLVQERYKYNGEHGEEGGYKGWSPAFTLRDNHPIVLMMEMYQVNKVSIHRKEYTRQVRLAK